MIRKPLVNNYMRRIKTIKVGMKKINGKMIPAYRDVYVDVYDVIRAFNVTDPAMAHAIKKCLAAGQRGAKDSIKDKNESIQAIERSIVIEEEEEIYSSLVP